jgi:hypothetical protein
MKLFRAFSPGSFSGKKNIEVIFTPGSDLRLISIVSKIFNHLVHNSYEGGKPAIGHVWHHV